uniref:Ubiquitin associated protein 1 like n=1 Tax=Crocodylus porosus TaxID=8502 RepID=A0A7M4DUR8_CROPO
MGYLDDVPFRTYGSFEDGSAKGTSLISPPDIEVPDCTEILTSTMHDFSLERKVLYWIEAASRQATLQHHVTTEAVPTAPPCWLLLVDSKENLGLRAVPRFPQLDQRRPKTSPGLLEPPSERHCNESNSPDLNKQRRSLVLFNNVKNELEGARKKLAALKLSPRPFLLRRCSRRYTPASDGSLKGALIPTPPSTPSDYSTPPATPCLYPTPPATPGYVLISEHKVLLFIFQSLSPYSCLPAPSGAARPLSSHRTRPDSTADLLSALSQEERDLIEPVLALGYPIRRAILALQKTGRQSLGQFLSYLSACDRLLKQGYEEGQVEEAMEMFQYSEKKAAEFLHLLAQFDDMGFQQAEIKEVLLLCENQRDKALEELMTRSQ